MYVRNTMKLELYIYVCKKYNEPEVICSYVMVMKKYFYYILIIRALYASSSEIVLEKNLDMRYHDTQHLKQIHFKI